MTTQKYTIIDDSDNPIGHILIKPVIPTFQHTSISSPIPASGPIADSILLLASLSGFTLTAWFAFGSGWLAPSLGLTVTAVLAGLKVWKLSEQADQEATTDELTIKVESWQGDGQVLLDEIEDKSISLEDWRKVARAIVQHEVNFSRPALSEFVSQTTYHKVKAEFVRLNFAHRKGNNYTLSPRALSFLKKLHALPY